MKDDDKPAVVDLARRLRALGFTLDRHRRARTSTWPSKGIETEPVQKVTEGRPNIVDKIVDGRDRRS